MSSGFSVEPGTVRAAGTDLTTLASAVLRARLCVELNVHVDDGGTFLNDIARSANEVRAQLLQDYSTSGNAYTNLENAGLALHGMADDYQHTDHQQAARYDGRLDTPSVEAPPYLGGKPGIEYDDYLFVTDVPDAFEGYDQLEEFTESVEFIIGLDWLSSWLTTAGIVDPFADFREKMAGDWKKLGRVVGALDNLDTFWTTAQADIDSVPSEFVGQWVQPPGGPGFYQYDYEYNGSPNWSGHACDATVDWINRVADKMGDHAYMIELKSSELKGRLMAMYDAMDLLLDAVQDLLEIMPWGQSFEDFVEELVLPWKIASRLVEIAGKAAKILVRVRALFDAVSEVLGIFAGLLYALGDLAFPQVVFHAPRVGG